MDMRVDFALTGISPGQFIPPTAIVLRWQNSAAM
jgi:hypothetical protein